MSHQSILIVDDDTEFCAMLAERLRAHGGYSTQEEGGGLAAIDRVKRQHFDAVLLDVNLTDMDGRDVCRIMRRNGVKSPIVMLTAADTDADAILGLDSGANDYVTKPFRMDVLLARLRGHLRQHTQSTHANVAIGPYSFRPARKVLFDTRSGKRIHLTDKETALLKFLCLAENRRAERDVLLVEIWGYNERVTTHTLETHIYRLRQKIERDPQRPELLVTEPGGYRLIL